jgi:hypothetical protein
MWRTSASELAGGGALSPTCGCAEAEKQIRSTTRMGNTNFIDFPLDYASPGFLCATEKISDEDN